MNNPILDAIKVASREQLYFDLTVTLTNGQTFFGEPGKEGQVFVLDHNGDTRHIFFNPDHILHVEVHWGGRDTE
jgi:hypothetical protein